MPNGKLTHSGEDYNYHLHGLTNFYFKKLDRLVRHLYSQGYTVTKVAEVLGVTPKTISLQFPKKENGTITSGSV